jgi:hypothetical protein
MAERKNKGGAPKGNKNAVRATIARSALIKALKKKSGFPVMDGRDEFESMVRIWEKQIDLALEGSFHACAQICDRLDGKVALAVSGTIEHDHDHKHTHTHEHKPISDTAKWIEETLGAGTNSAPEKPVSH